MKKLMILAALAAMFAGCSVTKVEYEQGDNGKVSYRLYRNSHWLKTEGEGMRGGMTGDGKFEFDLEGLKSSPSEEFNRTMQTYTTAFVQLAQIAAAAYNPSASAAISGLKSSEVEKLKSTEVATNDSNTQTPKNSNTQPDCADGKCSEVATGDSNTQTPKNSNTQPDCSGGKCSEDATGDPNTQTPKNSNTQPDCPGGICEAPVTQPAVESAVK